MKILRYSSGDEIRETDTVECGDGLIGEVITVKEPWQWSQPTTPEPGYFSVKRTDGTCVSYPPSDPSVKLLSRVLRMSSETMHATIKKSEFLKLLEDLGAHSSYSPETLVDDLNNCGVSTTVAPDSQGLIVEGQLIPVSPVEWGEPGISTLSVLGTVYELATGVSPRSSMNGRGFWYRDIMDKLAKFWHLDVREKD